MKRIELETTSHLLVDSVKRERERHHDITIGPVVVETVYIPMDHTTLENVAPYCTVSQLPVTGSQDSQFDSRKVTSSIVSYWTRTGPLAAGNLLSWQFSTHAHLPLPDLLLQFKCHGSGLCTQGHQCFAAGWEDSITSFIDARIRGLIFTKGAFSFD